MSLSSNRDEGVINLRNDSSVDDEAEFRINHIEKKDPPVEVRNSVSDKFEVKEADMESLRSSDKVKIKFDKFVNLIATHNYEEVFEKHMDEDVVISTDLLADLANSHEETEDKKNPVIFLVGILLGVVLTWILLKT